MDEWGECTIKSGDTFPINQEGVIRCIGDNDPAITSVVADGLYSITDEDLDEDEVIPLTDWAAAGQCIGESKHIKHLELRVSDMDSQDNVKLFCGGLVANRSIQALVIRCYDDEGYGTGDERFIALIDELFKALLPLFENNRSLESLAIDFPDDFVIVESIYSAFEACQSLKSIRISACQSNSEKLDILVEIICRKRGLRHLSFHWCSLSKNACVMIKSLLSDENCTLMSLLLDDVIFNEETDLYEISCGLTINKTLKRIKVNSLDDEVTLPALSLLKNVESNVLEELQLTGCGPIPILTPLAVMMQRMSMLKSLTIGTHRISGDIIASLPTTLHELKLTYAAIDSDETLHELASYLSKSASLKRLSFFNSAQLPALGWCSFFNSAQLPVLEELHLYDVVKNDSVMNAMCQFMASNHKVRVLNLWGGSYGQPAISISSEGWSAFVSMLKSHTGIEELVVNGIGYRAEQFLGSLVDSLVVSSKLKCLRVELEQFGSLQAIANAVARSDCLLEVLDVKYIPAGTDPSIDSSFFMDSEMKHALLTMTLVSALGTNTSLKNLNVQHRISSTFDWSTHFCSLICSKTSIDATFQSNHSLQSLGFGASPSLSLPVQLYSMLHLNKIRNKNSVAREKVLQHHDIEDVNFEPSVLPLVLSCVANTGSPRLSQLFGILRRVPHVIQKGQKKRKMHEIEI
jgi:hypothetical protein